MSGNNAGESLGPYLQQVLKEEIERLKEEASNLIKADCKLTNEQLEESIVTLLPKLVEVKLVNKAMTLVTKARTKKLPKNRILDILSEYILKSDVAAMETYMRGFSCDEIYGVFSSLVTQVDDDNRRSFITFVKNALEFSAIRENPSHCYEMCETSYMINPKNRMIRDHLEKTARKIGKGAEVAQLFTENFMKEYVQPENFDVASSEFLKIIDLHLEQRFMDIDQRFSILFVTLLKSSPEMAELAAPAFGSNLDFSRTIADLKGRKVSLDGLEACLIQFLGTEKPAPKAKTLAADVLRKLTTNKLSGIRLQNACLDGVNLSQLFFIGSDLSHSSFKGCDLRDANFSKANLTSCNFDGADLSRTKLPEANLRGAILDNTKLIRTVFVGCTLDSVSLLHTETYKTDTRFASLKKVVTNNSKPTTLLALGEDNSSVLLTNLDLNESNTLIAGAGNDLFIRIIQVKPMGIVRKYKPHDDLIFAVKFGPVDSVVISSSADGFVHLYNWREMQSLLELKTSDINELTSKSSRLYGLSLAKKSGLIAAGGKIPKIPLWKVELSGGNFEDQAQKHITCKSHSLVSLLDNDSQSIIALEFSPCENYLAYGGNTSQLMVAQIDDHLRVDHFRTDEDKTYGNSVIKWVNKSPGHLLLVSGSLAGRISIWDLASKSMIGVYKEASYQVMAMDVTCRDNFIVAGLVDGSYIIINIFGNGKLLTKKKVHGSAIRMIRASSGDHSWFLTCSQDKTLSIQSLLHGYQRDTGEGSPDDIFFNQEFIHSSPSPELD